MSLFVNSRYLCNCSEDGFPMAIYSFLGGFRSELLPTLIWFKANGT